MHKHTRVTCAGRARQHTHTHTHCPHDQQPRLTHDSWLSSQALSCWLAGSSQPVQAAHMAQLAQTVRTFVFIKPPTHTCLTCDLCVQSMWACSLHAGRKHGHLIGRRAHPEAHLLLCARAHRPYVQVLITRGESHSTGLASTLLPCTQEYRLPSSTPRGSRQTCAAPLVISKSHHH
jgi:hypothetical protein